MTGKILKGGDEMNEHYTKLSPIDMEILSEAEKKLASSTGNTELSGLRCAAGLREIKKPPRRAARI